MIDPDGMQIQRTNLSSSINVNQVPEFDSEVYNLEDDKDYKAFINDVKRCVRSMFEYRAFIKYLRENMAMNKCAFLKGVSNEETFDIRIEIHHYPFTLTDIVEIVYRKRCSYRESLSVFMVAKEVEQLHYKLLVGLLPLSETVHELAHAGRLFIPVDRVVGRYNLFIDYYKPFCTPEQLETIDRIEKYTLENSDILDTTILDQNRVVFNVSVDRFQLPQFGQITDNMFTQLKAIKENNYMLPTIEDKQQEPAKKVVECPIEFDQSLISDQYR